MYRYEMHLHTVACSACAVSTIEEMVYAAKEKGYSGFVVTNHFYNDNTSVDRSLPIAEFTAEYARDWQRGKELGDQLGIQVFFGLEEGFGGGKEVLIYGMTPEQIAAASDWKEWGLNEMEAYAHANGAFLVHAHPFRTASYIPDPDAEPDITKFDALEIYNRGNQPIANEKAVAFAARTNMPGTSGGDVHNFVDFGTSGLAFYEPLTDNASLVKALREGRYKRIIDGEIID